MGKSCLVTGKSGPLMAQVVRRAAESERRTLVTRSGQMELGDIDEDITSLITWNRRSALSARSVLLHSSNIFGRLDEAIVLFIPSASTATFHESPIVGIEDRIDAEVKGFVYILREIFAQMIRQGGGSVVLAIQHPDRELQTPVEAAATGSFVSLADSLFRYYRNEPVRVIRAETEADDPDGFASFLIERLRAAAAARTDRSLNRWLGYPPRFSFARRRVSR